MPAAPIEILITLPFSEGLVEDLQNISPRLHITIIPTRRAEDISPEVWARTEILYTDRVLPNLSSVPNLKWIQFHYAGIDFYADSPLVKKKEITATTLSGAAATQMAEYTLSLLLALGYRIPDIIANQKRAEWPPDRWERFIRRELRGSTIGLVGYGSINRELARLLQPFRATILAAKRDAMHPEDEGYTPRGQGDPEGNLFSRLYPFQALQSMLKECDFIVVALPLTQSTRGIIGKDQFAVMKPTAYLVDVGRGGVIDPAALFDALQDRRIGGAALDVFAEEPLPPTSPFWKLSNTIISPHIAGISARYDEQAMDLFAENLGRYLNGVGLLNRFDPEKGY